VIRSSARTDMAANRRLVRNGGCDWTETSRYEQKTESQAKASVTQFRNKPDGVFHGYGYVGRRHGKDKARSLSKRLLSGRVRVTAAFWLQTSDDGKLYFYIVSPLVEKDGPASAYRRLHTAIRQLPQPSWIDPLRVKLIGENDRLAKRRSDIDRSMRMLRAGTI